MSDFPQSHTTHTTTTTSTVTVTNRLSFDSTYIRTLPGILNIAQAVLALITFICSLAAGGINEAGFGAFVGIMGFFFALGWLFIHLFHVEQTSARVPWTLLEFATTAFWTLFFFIAGICLAAYASKWRNYYYGPVYVSSGYYTSTNSWSNAAAAGSFFAFVATIAFGIGTFFMFREYRQTASLNRGPQGHA